MMERSVAADRVWRTWPRTRARPFNPVAPGVACLTQAVAVAMSVVALAAPGAYAQTETIRVDVKLRTGGSLSGPVVDHTDHGLVIVAEGAPYVFAWEELEADSACITRRALVVLQRGGQERLTAEDYLLLGRFGLRHGCRAFAIDAFRDAERLDPRFSKIVAEALGEPFQEEDPSERFRRDKAGRPSDPERHEPGAAGLAARLDAELTGVGPTLVPEAGDDVRERVLDVYRTFGTKVQEVLGEDVALVESEHFLIWTDWEPRYRDRLARRAESMYRSLSEAFGIAPTQHVFLAKCPIFCWAGKARFRRFARYFDGYDGQHAVGYTRSIESSGHVHVVLLRQGRSPADFDRFAWTLVHEGTHAFVHRLYTPRLIPHWVNEGLAELTAERILGDRCPAGENAALLARQYVRYDWPIEKLLRGTGPIGVDEYPLAHSVVALLEASGRDRFAGFIKDLKSGHGLEEALAACYDALTLEELETRWRWSVRQADPKPATRPEDSSRLPWADGR
jgi:hypothetical protein